jgi:hypothetical protein
MMEVRIVDERPTESFTPGGAWFRAAAGGAAGAGLEIAKRRRARQPEL